MISVTVDQLFLSNMGFAILLKSVEDDRSLPIMIGAAEAQAIALCINNVEVPRPLTHDLFKNVLDSLGCNMQRVEVCDLKSGTFFARLILDYGGTELVMDSRPSDAIALALRFDAPILIESAVMDKAGTRVHGRRPSEAGEFSGSNIRCPHARKEEAATHPHSYGGAQKRYEQGHRRGALRRLCTVAR